MKINIKKIICIIFSVLLLFPVATGISTDKIVLEDSSDLGNSDFDPLVDISVTVEIQKIRSFDKHDKQVHRREYIDRWSDPDFYVKVFINDEEFTSPIWNDTKYIYDPQWSATLDVPDDEEFVDVKIQLWDWNDWSDKLCDISTAYDDQGYEDCFDVELTYSIKTGHWAGDDSNNVIAWFGDSSGYGRLNGCDDGSIYQHDRDCELWFDIYQNDYDDDGIPYWSEVNYHGTDPEFDDTGRDDDGDGVPIEWENKWGHYMWYDWHSEEFRHYWEYDDNTYNDHENLDPDNDGLSNLEEYLTSQWDSDPFRDDVFVELDQMEGSGDAIVNQFPKGSIELIRTAFDRQNIVFHIDDGSMGGGESIPFEDETDYEGLQEIYWNYFLHNDLDNWRRGVFHYGVMIYSSTGVAGAMYGPDCFYITSKGHEQKAEKPFLDRDTVFASAYMHELGHTFYFSPIGGHDRDSMYPWQIGWWKWRPYKSCMNYGYMYTTVDYSDGSRGKNDFDDWGRIDFTSFQDYWD